MSDLQKKITAIFLAAAAVLPMLIGCGGGAPSQTSASSADTGDSSTAEGTDAPVTAPETVDYAALLAENKYAESGLELCLNVIDDYYMSSKHILRTEPKSTTPAYVWPFASFLEMLSDALRLYPDNEKIKECYTDALTDGISGYRVKVSSLRTSAGSFKNIVYYNSSRGGSGDYYYDDNAWVCLQFLTAYELLGDSSMLDRAKELLDFFMTGIDDTLDGGIYWDKSFGSKNTCANGPVAICFLKAYKFTGEQSYLDTGKSLVDWLNKKMLDGSLYCDSISTSGSVNSWKAAYNQGTPIYASCLVYELTGESSYLTRAKRTATAARSLCFSVSGKGENQKVRMNGNPIYKSWCIGWLMRGYYEFCEVTGGSNSAFDYMESVLDYNESTKNSRGYYDPYFRTGDWAGESTTEVLQPCGVASVMLICARYDVYLKPAVSE